MIYPAIINTQNRQICLMLFLYNYKRVSAFVHVSLPP